MVFHKLNEFSFHTQKSQNHVDICMCVKTEMVALICRYPMNKLVDSIEYKLPVNKYTMNLINYFFLYALILIVHSESSDKKVALIVTRHLLLAWRILCLDYVFITHFYDNWDWFSVHFHYVCVIKPAQF